METDIYIKALDGSGEIQIPWLPEAVEFKANGKQMATYDILDSGEYKIPNGRSLRGFSWSSVFPGEGHSDLPFLRGEWQDPKKYQTILSRWYTEGTALRLLITGTPINHDVYLEDYQMQYAGGYGDYSYAVSFVEMREIKITGSKKDQSGSSSSGSSSSSSSSSSKSASKTYTIKSGDTLWAIAQKHLGSGAKYSQIYNLNKTIIEETAKKRGKNSSDGGHWIYPGTTIKLP